MSNYMVIWTYELDDICDIYYEDCARLIKARSEEEARKKFLLKEYTTFGEDCITLDIKRAFIFDVLYQDYIFFDKDNMYCVKLNKLFENDNESFDNDDKIINKYLDNEIINDMNQSIINNERIEKWIDINICNIKVFRLID